MKLFAFWEHSPWPPLLGTEVVTVYSNGLVEPKGYPGFRFKPGFFLPAKAGEKLRARLKELEQQHREEQADFDKRWRQAFADAVVGARR